jgi:hypothetical protein
VVGKVYNLGYGKVYPVDTVIGINNRGGSLSGVSRCGALNGRTILQGVDSMY